MHTENKNIKHINLTNISEHNDSFKFSKNTCSKNTTSLNFNLWKVHMNQENVILCMIFIYLKGWYTHFNFFFLSLKELPINVLAMRTIWIMEGYEYNSRCKIISLSYTWIINSRGVEFWIFLTFEHEHKNYSSESLRDTGQRQC